MIHPVTMELVSQKNNLSGARPTESPPFTGQMAIKMGTSSSGSQSITFRPYRFTVKSNGCPTENGKGKYCTPIKPIGGMDGGDPIIPAQRNCRSFPLRYLEETKIHILTVGAGKNTKCPVALIGKSFP
jgi:hypothetical protein